MRGTVIPVMTHWQGQHKKNWTGSFHSNSCTRHINKNKQKGVGHMTRSDLEGACLQLRLQLFDHPRLRRLVRCLGPCLQILRQKPGRRENLITLLDVQLEHNLSNRAWNSFDMYSNLTCSQKENGKGPFPACVLHSHQIALFPIILSEIQIGTNKEKKGETQ